MRMNNVEMNDKMLEQVNGGKIIVYDDVVSPVTDDTGELVGVEAGSTGFAYKDPEGLNNAIEAAKVMLVLNNAFHGRKDSWDVEWHICCCPLEKFGDVA